MLIIVEGADGTGKSTLVSELATTLTQRFRDRPNTRIHTLHRDVPRAHPLEEYEVPLTTYRPGRGEHIICDRWHLGELVYPRITGRETRYDDACHRHVDLLLQSRGALIVHLDPPRDTVHRWLTARHALSEFDRLTLARYTEITIAFMTALDRCGTLRMTWPCTAQQIIETAEFLEDAVRRLNPLTTYVGPPRPDVLLFGETRGVNGRLAHGLLPAFVPRASTSGHYLLSHLDTLDPNRVGLANACDVDHPTRVWETLQQPATVALGVAAAKRLRYLGIKHGTVPHPQFIRRFHHRAGAEYARLIREVAQTGEDMLTWRP